MVAIITVNIMSLIMAWLFCSNKTELRKLIKIEYRSLKFFLQINSWPYFLKNVKLVLPRKFITQELSSIFKKHYEICIEPGRSLVADSGILITRIVRTKNTSKKSFLIVGYLNLKKIILHNLP